jgi:hypothetical protein
VGRGELAVPDVDTRHGTLGKRPSRNSATSSPEFHLSVGGAPFVRYAGDTRWGSRWSELQGAALSLGYGGTCKCDFADGPNPEEDGLGRGHLAVVSLQVEIGTPPRGQGSSWRFLIPFFREVFGFGSGC